MYNVALCEDEKVFSDDQERVCRGILERLNIDHTITAFGSGADFLKAFSEENKRYDLILLDIVMDEINGVELARKIRVSDEETAIVFITAHRDYSLEGYDVNALHYLMKPLDISVLERLIQTDYTKRFQNDFFIFDTGAGAVKYRAATRDIISLETAGRKVKVTLTDRTIYCPGKLVDLLSELPGEKGSAASFVRCHQAFAVNICNVRELTKQSVITANGQEIPVSRQFAKDVQKAFVRQLREI